MSCDMCSVWVNEECFYSWFKNKKKCVICENTGFFYVTKKYHLMKAIKQLLNKQ